MIYVQETLRDYQDQDVQYVETLSQEKPLSQLTDREAWAIKDPSRGCVEQIQNYVLGCEVKVFKHVRYLMSPKALLYFPVQDKKRDVVLLTFTNHGYDYFLMVHMAGRHFWHLPWCDHDQLSVFLSTAFALVPDAPLPFKVKVSWKVMKQHHKVIDWKTFLHFRLFHCHFQLHEVETLFTHCGIGIAHLEGVLPLTTPQTFASTNPLFHSLMIVPKACVANMQGTINGVTVDQWHLDAANRAFGTGKLTHRRMRGYSTIN